MRDPNLLKDNYDKVYYAVIIEGKTVFTAGNEMSAEHYKTTLPADVQAKAKVEMITIDGKQILFG